MKNLKKHNSPSRQAPGDVDHLIIAIRGHRVILDADLVAIYGSSPKFVLLGGAVRLEG